VTGTIKWPRRPRYGSILAVTLPIGLQNWKHTCEPRFGGTRPHVPHEATFATAIAWLTGAPLQEGRPRQFPVSPSFVRNQIFRQRERPSGWRNRCLAVIGLDRWTDC
jgi:hypothetical protein